MKGKSLFAIMIMVMVMVILSICLLNNNSVMAHENDEHGEDLHVDKSQVSTTSEVDPLALTNEHHHIDNVEKEIAESAIHPEANHMDEQKEKDVHPDSGVKEGRNDTDGPLLQPEEKVDQHDPPVHVENQSPEQQPQQHQKQSDTPHHPYYPIGLSLPRYIPNTISDQQVLLNFSLISTSIMGCAFLLLSWIARKNKDLYHKGFQILGYQQNDSFSTMDYGLFIWFVYNGFLHIIFEGHYGLNHKTTSEDNHLFAQLLKLYALADSRYLTSDSFVVVIETITALIWGPIALYTAYCIAARSSHRHIAQTMISSGHVYGVLLYFGTTMIEGSPHSRPEPIYFWMFFVYTNSIWLVVAGIALYHSFRSIVRMATTHKIHSAELDHLSGLREMSF